ncbi:hypothetical protein JCM16161A_22090 [Vulcanisaeta sp. JCM 16161]
MKVRNLSNTLIFVGLVGSGKSTQISLLKRFISKNNLCVKDTYLKTVFIFTPLFLGLFRRFLTNRGIKIIHKIAVELDLILNVFVLPLLKALKCVFCKGCLVLVEEHFPGSIVDYYHASLILGIKMSLIRILIRMMYTLFNRDLKNATTIILFSDFKTLKNRWRKRGSRDEAVTYLYVQLLVFNAWNKLFPTISINNSNLGIYETAFNIIVNLKRRKIL